MDYLKDIPQFSHLNEKQQKFITHYFTDANRNGAEAARLAGYSKKNPSALAVRLMKDNRIKMIVKEVTGRMLHDHSSLRSRIIIELCGVAFSSIKDFMSWAKDNLTMKDSAEISDENMKVIAEVSESINMFGTSKKIKFHDKIAAIRELNKMHGFYKDNDDDDDGRKKNEIHQTTLVILPSNGREK